MRRQKILVGGLVVLAIALISTKYIFAGTYEEKPSRVSDLPNGPGATLDIDLQVSTLKIVPGDYLNAVSPSRSIQCLQNENHIKVEEKKSGFWFFARPKASTLTVTVPAGLVFDSIQITAGAGQVDLDTIAAKNIELNLGASEVNLNNLVVSGEAVINSGTGELNIDNAALHNLELNLGVGEVNFTGTLPGNSNLKAGVGEVNLTLADGLEPYRFTVGKGIGEINFDGVDMGDGDSWGAGKNNVVIQGGVGEINVIFAG